MTEYLLYRLVILIVSRIPLRAAYGLGNLIAFFYFHMLRVKEREILKENLRVVFPGWEEKKIAACARKNFTEFGKFIVDFFRLHNFTRSELKNMVEISGRRYINKASEENRGIIAVSGHIGNWELGAAAFALEKGPVNAVALDHSQKKVNDLFVRQRASKNVNTISVSPGLRKTFRALKNGGIVAIVGDRDVTGRGREINFFGRPAVFPDGAFVLSCRTGAPVLPVFNIRQAGGGCKMIVHEPFRPGGGGDEKMLLEEWAAVFAEYVRTYPHQWFMYHRVWRD